MESTERIRKKNGVHYTPPGLAQFLAAQIVLQLAPSHRQPLRIFDPACGNGELLLALIQALPVDQQNLSVLGCELDSEAAERTRQRLSHHDLAAVQIVTGDFLQPSFVSGKRAGVDIVIANPPYVRTQVLGGQQSQRLAKEFDLTGRVDLYHAFGIAMARVLAPGGVLGLLTSNRFLSVKSGATLRDRLAKDFELREIFDLGDTKLFEAAVLPAIVIAVKRNRLTNQSKLCVPRPIGFQRVYLADHVPHESSTQPQPDTTNATDESILEVLSGRSLVGRVKTPDGLYNIERGQMLSGEKASVWSLSNSTTRRWLDQIRGRSVAVFGDVAEIKVGIKTTADAVFIRDDWHELPLDCQPEPQLLRPLVTHHQAGRWHAKKGSNVVAKRVLYPYQGQSPPREPIDLSEFPHAAAYFHEHHGRLSSRKYLTKANRKWYEIWVPHQPSDWKKPKIVWPDISAEPRFFLDSSGAIVNGDCYWIKLRENVDPDWNYLMLAVANSNIATRYYDTVFHNKLYSGRRRFMTQYVKEFPLPELNSPIGRQTVALAKQLTHQTNEVGESKMAALMASTFA